jgi:hypothetical protein
MLEIVLMVFVLIATSSKRNTFKSKPSARPPMFNQTSDSSKFKTFNEVDEEAIREALMSQGDKSMLVEKLISVLKLAREVQGTNVQLRYGLIYSSASSHFAIIYALIYSSK